MDKDSKLCHCCSNKPYSLCCAPFIEGKELPPTPLALMRSRYSAYVLANATYLIDTTHPSTRHLHSKKSILQWSQSNVWKALEIVEVYDDVVAFKAIYQNSEQEVVEHFERSNFAKLGQRWYYVDGVFTE